MRRAEIIAACILGAWLMLGGLLATLVDALVTMIAPPRVSYYLAFGIVWLLPVYAYLDWPYRRTSWPLAMTFLLYLVTSLGLPWGEGDRFLLRLADVHAGMSAEEVKRLMGKYERGPAFDPVVPAGAGRGVNALDQLFLSSDRCQQYGHSEPGRAADIAYVCFAAGRVIGTNFHPD